MASDKITLAHWCVNFSHPITSLDDWAAMVEAQLQKAALEKADILLMPEHLAEHWMHFAPKSDYTEEPAWMAAQASSVYPRLQLLVDKTGVALVAGSTAWRHEKTGNIRNRAWMFFPDRAPECHDKLVLTPSEKDIEGWNFETGDTVTVFEWRGLRLAMIICLDIEMPHLAHKMSSLDIDLLLVPSMTGKAAGYNRVYNCARARAVELMTAVAVVGNVGGTTKCGKARETYQSGAAVYIPSEEIFGHSGIFSELPLHKTSEGQGHVLYSRNIPVGEIRAVRRGMAEAWPGPWDASHVKVEVSPVSGKTAAKAA